MRGEEHASTKPWTSITPCETQAETVTSMKSLNVSQEGEFGKLEIGGSAES